MQGRILILAARALGLDAGRSAGSTGAKVDAEFFPAAPSARTFSSISGYGDPAGLYPRNPRLDFDEACRID